MHAIIMTVILGLIGFWAGTVVSFIAGAAFLPTALVGAAVFAAVSPFVKLRSLS